MKLSACCALAFTSTALAAPRLFTRTIVYDPTNAPAIFSDPTCTLSKSLTPGEPLSFAYPLADQFGTLATPALRTIVGAEAVEDLDAVADQLCINAQQDPNGGYGICQDTLQAIRDTVEADTPLAQSTEFKCLLDLLCIAHEGVPYNGLCDYLLAGLDCIANRIIGVEVKECD